MPKKWLARAGLVVASMGVVFLVAEAAVRLTWTEPWYERLEEEQSRSEFEWFSMGPRHLPLRQAPDTTPKAEGTRRVLFLGDSFTYGLGVAEDESFVSIVRERLAAQRDEQLQAFNGGIPGSMTEHWRLLFEKMGAEYEPDVVVTVFFLRDGVEGLTTRGLIGHVRKELQERSRTSVAYQISALYRLVAAALAQRRLSDWYLGWIETGYVGPPEQTAEWRRAQETLLELREQTERSGGRFVLVIFPVLFGLDQDEYPVQAAVDAIEDFAQRHDIPVLSLLPTYRGMHAPDLWVSALDQHPNVDAHRLAADAIVPFVSEQLAPR
ncbi:MAG: hypothetical protein DRH30_07165 [Deltaproteobacteria bacterium]|nr:MAG: hypothetical protein DRH30_07165 [Deltaproteobacteria bacterium]